jgi:hypothetical protein
MPCVLGVTYLQLAGCNHHFLQCTEARATAWLQKSSILQVIIYHHTANGSLTSLGRGNLLIGCVKTGSMHTPNTEPLCHRSAEHPIQLNKDSSIHHALCRHVKPQLTLLGVDYTINGQWNHTSHHGRWGKVPHLPLAIPRGKTMLLTHLPICKIHDQVFQWLWQGGRGDLMFSLLRYKEVKFMALKK